MADYRNPLRAASLWPERIDQGVDYSIGGGWLEAIGHGVVVQSQMSGSGWPGGWVAYVLTEPGPLQGMRVFYAEGIANPQRVGTRLQPGEGVCGLVPHWPTGLEIGWASGVGTTTWAREYGGGFDGEHSTAAGVQFSDLLVKLGAQGGIVNAPIMGRAPRLNIDGIYGSAFGQDGGWGNPPSPVDAPTGSEQGDIIRRAWAPLGDDGAKTQRRADATWLLVTGATYCTTEGVI